MQVEWLKEWWLELVIVICGLVLFATGVIFDFFPSIQVLMKKTFLVAWWYGLTYLFRRFRLGKIEWDDVGQKTYYFVLLLGSAIIFALG